MFRLLRLENFKSWRDTGPVRLAPVTAFFGSNSSGKTSILQSLLMLRQTVEDSDRRQTLTLSGIANLGTYSDIIFDHRESNLLKIRVDWTAEDQVTVSNLAARAKKKSSTIAKSDKLSLETSIALTSTDAVVEQLTYSINEDAKSTRFHLTHKGDDKYDLSSEEYDFVRNPGRAWPLPRPNKFYGFPDQVRVYFQNASFLSDLELEFEKACRRIRYLGPLREDPKREYIFTGGAPQDVGRRGELAVSALVSSMAQQRKISRGWIDHNHTRRLKRLPIEEVIAQWLSTLGLIDSFRLERLDDRNTLYRVSVKQGPNSPPVLLTDVGFGVSQVLPVLVLLAYADEGDTVILEQPEIHLHPAVQSGLADIILESALARGIQIIFESHSEHLLSRIQRRIAEEHLHNGITITPEDVALYFCDQTEGVSHLENLHIDLFGNITNWPPGFFGDPMADQVAMLEAKSRRTSRMGN
ncbi:hypothetical protein MHAS_03705 [Mycolicibacterium hassiacum DSM 44199]|uniref:AAA family ATPase n=1 Tax=Mycolicibacterium hassiacum TaxID=46351 RepID=UPI0009D9AD9F|nr:DUF3696 domain-containing protein [Mycolicibacterium hassiacum]VCT91981.1 hypothetical protein MHAS_03705 [Mycolicibacterium hassiacum DSM 44199]